MSLRWRLTVLTSIILLLSTALLGAASVLTAMRIQFDSIDRNLKTSVVTERVNGLVTNPRPVPADVYSTVAIVQVDRDGATRTLRRAGYGTAPLALPSLDASSVEAARQGPVTLHGEPDFRAVANSPNGRGDSIVALTPLTAVNEQLQQLILGVVAAALVVTLVGTTLAWLLLGRGLRPVGAMAGAARAIAEGDFAGRVPPAPSGTELGQLSESLNMMIASLTSSIAEVRESEARLQAFVSDASHELRTPVTVIRGYSELLARTPAERTELESRALERIGEEVRRLEHLLNQLLTLQRASDPSSITSVEHVDVADVFDRVFAGFADLHPDREVVLDLVTSQVRGTDDEWTAVAANLAQNIDRYTPEGSSVHVGIAHTGRTCVITVDDEGPGIPQYSRVRMLERFTRLDDSRATETGGSGLGLSIARAMAERHGGAIVLEASPQGGLRVRITAPLFSALNVPT